MNKETRMFLWGLILLFVSILGIFFKLIRIKNSPDLDWVDFLILSIWVVNAWRGINLINKTIE